MKSTGFYCRGCAQDITAARTLVSTGRYCKGDSLLHHLRFGSGPDVIFLHGWGGSTDSFITLARRFQNSFTVTLVDFYGFGKTPKAEKSLTLDDYVGAVADIIRRYGMQSVTLVGHSFGGRVALKLAARYGYLIDRIILIDSAGLKPRRKPAYYLSILRHRVLTLLKIKHTSGSADYRVLDSISKQTFKNIINEDLIPILKTVTLPTLIIWGSKDKETPIYMARKLYKNLANPAMIIFRGAGHYAYLERFGEIYMLLKTYLTEGAYALADAIGNHNLGRRTVLKIPHAKPK